MKTTCYFITILFSAVMLTPKELAIHPSKKVIEQKIEITKKEAELNKLIKIIESVSTKNDSIIGEENEMYGQDI